MEESAHVLVSKCSESRVDDQVYEDVARTARQDKRQQFSQRPETLAQMLEDNVSKIESMLADAAQVLTQHRVATVPVYRATATWKSSFFFGKLKLTEVSLDPLAHVYQMELKPMVQFPFRNWAFDTNGDIYSMASPRWAEQFYRDVRNGKAQPFGEDLSREVVDGERVDLRSQARKCMQILGDPGYEYRRHDWAPNQSFFGKTPSGFVFRPSGIKPDLLLTFGSYDYESSSYWNHEPLIPLLDAHLQYTVYQLVHRKA